jgi:6,7-dimethyl-8-ribityllumazine synthase
MTKAGTTPSTLVEEPGATGPGCQLDGKPFHIAIVYTRWYEHIVQPLVDACKKELLDKGVESANICTVRVPGAFELPFAAKRIIKTSKVDAVVAIGCMIKGATMAYEFLSETVTLSLMKLNIKTDVPVIFGVLTAMDETEAKKCAGIEKEKTCNQGVEWAQSALELAHLRKKTAEKIQTRCNCKCHCKEDCSCSCHCTKCKCRTCTCGASCSCQHCVGYEHEQESKQQQAASTSHGYKSCEGSCKTSSGTCGDKMSQGIP